ncbi:MAG TPA: mercury(II) reductase [Gemmatimonadaceae bacterium]
MANSTSNDLIVIGTGAAGMAAAIRASELGARTAIVEARDVVGGTCVNVGCIPSKWLVEVASRYHASRVGFPGIASSTADLDWAGVQRAREDLVDGLRREKYEQVLAGLPNATLLFGRAELLGAGRVRVGDRQVSAAHIVIATGTHPAVPTIEGLAAAEPLDSTSVMELEELPHSMIIIGGGSIGLELGQAFQRLGVQVTILEAANRILPAEHPDASALVTELLTREGLVIRSGVRMKRVDRRSGRVEVAFSLDGREEAASAEQLLVATGRRPNTARLGLEASGVRTDARGFIVVDQDMATSAEGVFAAGDVTGGPGFVYVAAAQGGIAAQSALGRDDDAQPMDLMTVPRVTFTEPQVAAVGLTPDDGWTAGFKTRTASLPLRHLARAAVSRHDQGFVSLIADAATDRLVGAHIVAPNAGDMIGEVALALRMGLRVDEVVTTLHPYLTWVEGVKLAAQTFSRDVARLSCCA